MITVGQWLAAHADLERLDRELLIGRATGLSRARILARPERTLTPDATARLEAWADRRRQGEPLAYLLGDREFWGLDLTVSPAVLVPRPETELLVETGLALLERPGAEMGFRTERADAQSAARSREAALRVLDLGTGSGAVAIAMVHERADLIVIGSDVSHAALTVAAGNAYRLGVTVHWVQSDWLEAFAGPFDLILSNPPYVAEADPHLRDLAHEPHEALVAGRDGLEAIGRIISTAADRLRPGGALALEHGATQAGAVRALLAAAGFQSATTRRDLAGHERVSFGYRPEAVP